MTYDPEKHLVNPDGSLTPEAMELVQEVVRNYSKVFAKYMKDGYNVFEILGVLTSALINAQKQAWLDSQ